MMNATLRRPVVGAACRRGVGAGRGRGPGAARHASRARRPSRRVRWGAAAAGWLLLAWGAGGAAQEAELLPGELPLELGRELLDRARAPRVREIMAAVQDPAHRPLVLVRLFGDDNNHYAPAFSGDGTALAFLRSDLDAHTCKLLTMAALHQRVPDVLYSDFLSYEHMPCWNLTPRRLLVFASNNEEDREENLHLTDLHGPPRRVTTGAGIKVLPSLIVRGGQAQLLYRGGNEVLHLRFPADGGGTPESKSWEQAEEARLAPSGRDAAVVRAAPDGGQRLYLRDLQTNDELLLHAPENQLIRNPVWSPDGRRLAYFARPRAERRWQLWQVGRGGEPAPQRLAEGVRVQEDFRHVTPAWSPAGDKVWFFADAGEQGYYPVQWVAVADGKRGQVDYPKQFTTAMDLAANPDAHRPMLAFVAVRQHALDVFVMVLNHY